MTLSVVFFIDLNLVLHRDLFVRTGKLTSDPLKLRSCDRYWRRWGTARVTDLWSAQAQDLCFFLKKQKPCVWREDMFSFIFCWYWQKGLRVYAVLVNGRYKIELTKRRRMLHLFEAQ